MDRIDKFLKFRKQTNKRIIRHKSKEYTITKNDMKILHKLKKNMPLRKINLYPKTKTEFVKNTNSIPLKNKEITLSHKDKITEKKRERKKKNFVDPYNKQKFDFSFNTSIKIENQFEGDVVLSQETLCQKIRDMEKRYFHKKIEIDEVRKFLDKREESWEWNVVDSVKTNGKIISIYKNFIFLKENSLTLVDSISLKSMFSSDEIFSDLMVYRDSFIFLKDKSIIFENTGEILQINSNENILNLNENFDIFMSNSGEKIKERLFVSSEKIPEIYTELGNVLFRLRNLVELSSKVNFEDLQISSKNEKIRLMRQNDPKAEVYILEDYELHVSQSSYTIFKNKKKIFSKGQNDILNVSEIDGQFLLITTSGFSIPFAKHNDILKNYMSTENKKETKLNIPVDVQSVRTEKIVITGFGHKKYPLLALILEDEVWVIKTEHKSKIEKKIKGIYTSGVFHPENPWLYLTNGENLEHWIPNFKN